MKNTSLKRVLALILSISIFLGCNMGPIKVKAEEVKNIEKVQEKTTMWGQDVANFAMSLLGKPYKENGSTLEGFDLGGFTMYVYSNSVGINIDNKIYRQRYSGISVNYEDIKLGDLIFTDDGSTYGIVGIYVGNDEYIYASKKGVIVEKISNFKFARRIIDNEEQVLKINKGETYEITNTSDETICLLTDNIDANVDATYCNSDNLTSISSIDDWRVVEEGCTVKFTVLEENGLNIYYPSKIQNSIKKLNTPTLCTVNVEPGKNYELINNCEKEYILFNAAKGKFNYTYDGYLSFTGYIYWSKIDSELNVGPLKKNFKVKFYKCDEGNISFKLPYELKDSFKEVSTPVFKKVVLNKGEILELNSPNKIITYFTSATEENGIRYSQVYKRVNDGADGACYRVEHNIYGPRIFANKCKMKLESGENVEILLPYDFNGYKKIKEEPIYYEAEILPGQVYEFKNIYQASRERLFLSDIKENSLNGLLFHYNGWKNNINVFFTGDTLILRGGDIIRFTTSGDESVKLYLPLEFKDLLSKVDGPMGEEYGYEIEDINKDKKVDTLDLSIAASNYNKVDTDPFNKMFCYEFDDRCDFNNDGIIDLYDLVAVARKF